GFAEILLGNDRSMRKARAHPGSFEWGRVQTGKTGLPFWDVKRVHRGEVTSGSLWDLWDQGITHFWDFLAPIAFFVSTITAIGSVWERWSTVGIRCGWLEFQEARRGRAGENAVVDFEAHRPLVTGQLVVVDGVVKEVLQETASE